MTTATMKTAEKTICLIAVSREGVRFSCLGVTKTIPWAALNAAAKQDDTDLAAVYAGLLDQAMRMAREKKEIEIRLRDTAGNGLGYAATLHTVSGEFVTGRLVAADFGLTGRRSEALADVASAKASLEASGYKVHMPDSRA